MKAQNSYDLSFYDVVRDTVIVANRNGEYSNYLFTIDLIKFRLHDAGASGPFLLGLDFIKFHNEKKSSFNII